MNEKSPSITFQNRINNIKEGYEELGNLTIKLTGTVVRLLENYDETDFENIEECSTTIDIKTIDLERECIKFMATEQPLAKDLMFIESTLRVISHFKRISHICLKIAKLIKNIQCADIPEKILKELEYMGDYTLIILKKSFFVFSNQDLDKAKELPIDYDLSAGILKPPTPKSACRTWRALRPSVHGSKRITAKCATCALKRSRTARSSTTDI